MKRILLTGCAGFIGSNFVKTIAAQNKDYEFDIVDALTYAGRKETIQNDLDINNHINFYHMDIRDQKSIDDLFLDRQYEGVIHFAAESHVDNSIKNPNIFVETNVIGTLNLLNSSVKVFKENNQFKFLHVSTDEVYGQLTEDDPAFTEKHQICPSSPYSASKASSDLLVLAYHETFGLPVVMTRCSNNYGPYQFPEKLIPLMISNAREDIKLPVYGDGKNIRDWIYVDDHNDGVWAVYTKGKVGEVYNLGGDSEKRNIEVVKTIIAQLNKSEDLITYVTDRPGHDWRYAMDFSKIQNELGWSPKVKFDEGIKKTINWYMENESWVQMVRNNE
jgi:dTDP-glucose 4,6-dehydratase